MTSTFIIHPLAAYLWDGLVGSREMQRWLESYSGDAGVFKGTVQRANSLAPVGAINRTASAVSVLILYPLWRIRARDYDQFVAEYLELADKALADIGGGKGALQVPVCGLRKVNLRWRLAVLQRPSKFPLMRCSVQYGVTGGRNDGAVFVRYGSVDAALGSPQHYSRSPAELIDTRDLDSLAKIIVLGGPELVSPIHHPNNLTESATARKALLSRADFLPWFEALTPSPS